MTKLKELRESKGWTQARLAEELGVDIRTIRRWERGQTIPLPYYRQQLLILFGQAVPTKKH